MSENDSNTTSAEIPDIDELQEKQNEHRRRQQPDGRIPSHDRIEHKYETFERRKKYFGHPDSDTSYAKRKVKLAAEDTLEELYDDEFPIDDPPDSFERFEAEMSVVNLRRGIGQLNFRDEITDPEIELAKQSIELMASYGQLAEVHMGAVVAFEDIPMEVRQKAAAELESVREENTESLSLREALARWLSA